MKKWNTPEVIDVNISETASGLTSYGNENRPQFRDLCVGVQSDKAVNHRAVAGHILGGDADDGCDFVVAHILEPKQHDGAVERL